MLDHLQIPAAALNVRDAVAKVLKEAKSLPKDLGGNAKTTEVGDAVLAAV
jgi:isocitrate/isopropylmalate dehydrogenase